jgi:DNA-binding response OmpR family regulator
MLAERPMQQPPAARPATITARILLVDDEPVYASAVAARLRDADFDVCVAPDGVRALEAFEQEPFDLVLLDVMLPGVGGLDLASRIRQHSEVPIVVMSGYEDRESRLRAFDEGADDLISKTADFDETVRRLKAVLRRSSRQGVARITWRGKTLTVDSIEACIDHEPDPLPLTRTELKILHALAMNRGVTMEVDRLSQEVWGHQTFGRSNYIQSHVSRLRRKLAAAGCRDLVETVYKVGYLIR